MWIVWRPGSPDPSRAQAAIHFDDPAKDRDTSGRLAVIAVAPEHRGMALAGLLAIETYNLPAAHRAAIDGEVVRAVGAGEPRLPATAEA